MKFIFALVLCILLMLAVICDCRPVLEDMNWISKILLVKNMRKRALARGPSEKNRPCVKELESCDCFPSVAKVRLEDGKSVSMSDLKIGDKVQTVSSGGMVKYSKVRTFLNKDDFAVALYKSLRTESNKTITLSEEHLIYTRKDPNDKFIPLYAHAVKVGYEVLVHGNDVLLRERIVNVSSSTMQGAYVPLTADGNIVVDDVLASCYTVVDHNLAHLTMSPIQWYPEIMEWIFGLDGGFPGFVSISRDLGKRVTPFHRNK